MAPSIKRPSNYSGLQLWLGRNLSSFTKDGSNRVSQWWDQSGNSRHFTNATGATQPLWLEDAGDGRMGVYFDNARTDRLAYTGGNIINWNTDATVIICARPYDTAISASAAIMTWEGTTSPFPRLLFWFSNGVYFRGNFGNDASAELELFHVVWPGVPQPLMARRSGANLLLLGHKHIGMATSGAAPASPITLNKVMLGHYVPGVAPKTVITEVVCYNRALTDTEFFELWPYFCNGQPELPVVSNVSPASGSPIDRFTPIEFEFHSNDKISSLSNITVVYSDFTEELVFNGSAFQPGGPFEELSWIDFATDADWTFHIEREGGWPNTLEAIRIMVVDQMGASGGDELTYSVSPIGGQPIEIGGYSPPVSTVIESDDVLQFDISCTDPIRRVVVYLKYAGLTFEEVAFQGVPAAGAAGFTENFSGLSSITSLGDDRYLYLYRFQLKRVGGVWPGSPTLKVVAYNGIGDYKNGVYAKEL